MSSTSRKPRPPRRRRPAKPAKAPAKTTAAKTAPQEGSGRSRRQEGSGQEGHRREDRRADVRGRAAAAVGPDGKKVLADIPDEQFEKDVKTDPTIKEDEKEGFVVSAADETDEPEQQVMVAGATADPVKDYLKQIGKVPLLNAEMEVELAKRIEAGLFSEEKLAKGGKIGPRCSTSSSGSPRTAAAPRTTCSRPTSASSSRWPSATPAAACSSST